MVHPDGTVIQSCPLTRVVDAQVPAFQEEVGTARDEVNTNEYQSRKYSSPSEDEVILKATAYEGVTEIGYDCFITPRYVVTAPLSAFVKRNGGDEVYRKEDETATIATDKEVTGLDTYVVAVDGGGFIDTLKDATTVPTFKDSTEKEMALVISQSTEELTDESESADDEGVSSSNIHATDQDDINNRTDKAKDSRRDNEANRVETSPSSPPGHIYALREIIHPESSPGEDSYLNTEAKEGEEKGGEYKPVPSFDQSIRNFHFSSNSRPRIITTRAVCTTEEMHQHLERGNTGSLLCPAWRMDESKSVFTGHVFKCSNVKQFEGDAFFYSSGALPSELVPSSAIRKKRSPGKLNLVTVPVSDVKEQMGSEVDFGIQYKMKEDGALIEGQLYNNNERHGFPFDKTNVTTERDYDFTETTSKRGLSRRIMAAMRSIGMSCRKKKSAIAIITKSPHINGSFFASDTSLVLPTHTTIHHTNVGAALFREDAVIHTTVDPGESDYSDTSNLYQLLHSNQSPQLYLCVLGCLSCHSG
jgi:hypothetical protein